MGKNSSWFIDSGTEGPGNGGDIAITAKSIGLYQANLSTGDFHIRSSPTYFDIFENVTGSGGNVRITADSLNLNNSAISTAAFGGSGNAINLAVADIQITQGSSVETTGLGGSGAITITGNKLVMDSNTLLEAETAFDTGGDITIVAKVVELKDGSAVRTQTSGPSPSGNIIVSATDHITLSDGPVTNRPSGFYSNSLGVVGVPLDTLGGTAGAIRITTPQLQISGGARLNTGTETSGSGGDVIITADSISISGQRSLPVNEGFFNVGIGGKADTGGLFTGTVGKQFCSGSCGDAGHISINTTSLTLGSGSTIDSTTSSTGHGGNISIQATNQISLSEVQGDGSPAGVFSRTIGTDLGSGSGGNISLTAGQSVTISNGAAVSASSKGPGDTGNIQINAGNLFADDK